MIEKITEMQFMEQKIKILKAHLESSESEIGDWKIVKCMEYQMVGKEPPYDIHEIHAKRQAARDKINELEREIKLMGENL